LLCKTLKERVIQAIRGSDSVGYKYPDKASGLNSTGLKSGGHSSIRRILLMLSIRATTSEGIYAHAGNPLNLKVGDDSARLRFLREARAAASVRYPNVASVFHLGRIGQNYFYAREFVEGETLERLLG
jgi:hypothetical protein